jgi:hypothetical protein
VAILRTIAFEAGTMKRTFLWLIAAAGSYWSGPCCTAPARRRPELYPHAREVIEWQSQR